VCCSVCGSACCSVCVQCTLAYCAEKSTCGFPIGSSAADSCVAESVLQCVAVCCSVLQCVADSVLQCVAVCCGVLRCVAVCCSVLSSAADSCVAEGVLRCVAVCFSVLQCVAVCCSVLQCVAVCCSVLQSVAVCCNVCCSVLQFVACGFPTGSSASTRDSFANALGEFSLAETSEKPGGTAYAFFFSLLFSPLLPITKLSALFPIELISVSP